MDGSKIQVPDITNMNIQNITENTIIINSQGPDRRITYLLERLVTHLHDFAREARLSTKEWMTALEFLVKVGKISTNIRQEFILLSDVLGLSLLVDAIDHPKPENTTEGTVLGPFHTHEAEEVVVGSSISADTAGEPCLVICSVKDVSGNPIPDVKVDIWETDSTGHYDVQHTDHTGPDGRAILKTDPEGRFWFKAIVPVSYPIPHDGPVGQMLKLINRHPWRPAHMHFMFKKQGWDHLTTAIYIRPDPYLRSDAVFGVKDSLIVELTIVDEELAKTYGVPEGTKLLVHDFVLVSEEATEKLRDINAIEAVQKLFPGRNVRLLDHLPVVDVD